MRQRYGRPASGNASLPISVCLGAPLPRLTFGAAGTTPDSSAVTPMLISLCHQISYNLMLPFDDIPDEMVPLTAHLKELLLNATKEQVSGEQTGQELPYSALGERRNA